MAIMQSNGDFVVINNLNKMIYWSSASTSTSTSSSSSNAFVSPFTLVMQNDGSLSIYDGGKNSSAIWSTGSVEMGI